MFQGVRFGLGMDLAYKYVVSADDFTISGFAYPNETLTAPSGSSYLWTVNGQNRGTNQTFVPTVYDIGEVVTCLVGTKTYTTTVWHPRDIPSVQAFWWAAQGAYFTVANGVTDANASILTNGLYGPRTLHRAIGNDQNGKAAYGSGFGNVSSSWCYWNGSQWVLNTRYGEGANELRASSSDTTYPWQATWSNVTVTREATIVDALAADGQAVTAWRDIISGVDVTADTNNIALFEETDLPTASLKFDGTDFFRIPPSLRTVFNEQDYGYIFAGVKDTAINELGQNPSHGVVSINRTGSFPKVALTTRRSGNSYFDAITGPNSSVLTTADFFPNNEDYNVLTNEAMWADGQIRLRVNGEQSENVGSFEAVQPNNTVTDSYIGAYTDNTSNFVGYMTAIILATDLMSDTDRHHIERFIGLLGGLDIMPPLPTIGSDDPANAAEPDDTAWVLMDGPWYNTPGDPSSGFIGGQSWRKMAPIGYAPYGNETYVYGDEVVRYETGVWLYLNATLGEIARAYSYEPYPWLATTWTNGFTAAKITPTYIKTTNYPAVP
jgi:hypothetical protein